MDDIGRKVEVFGRNQVYDSYGGLSAAALNRQIPVMTIVGELPQYKGDKKTVRIEFSDLQKPERSFTAEGVTLNVQGTSSQYSRGRTTSGRPGKASPWRMTAAMRTISRLTVTRCCLQGCSA